MFKPITMKKGYTLIELVVAMTIIALLFTVGVVSYTKANERSRNAKRKNDIEQIRSALEMYRVDKGSYPDLACSAPCSTWSSASALSSLLIPDFMPSIPADPGTGDYQYLPTDGTGVKFYGYCLSTALESENPDDTCPPKSGDNYGVKNP